MPFIISHLKYIQLAKMSPILQCLSFLFVIVSSATTSKQNITSQCHSPTSLNNLTTHISTPSNFSSQTTNLSVLPTTVKQNSTTLSHSLKLLNSITTHVSTYSKVSGQTTPLSASTTTSIKSSKLQSQTTHVSALPTTSTKSSSLQSHSVMSLKNSTTRTSVHPRLSTTTTHHSSSLTTPASQATAGFSLPVAAAWLYMSDSTDYKNIPKWWNTMDFTKVDVLYVAPLGIQNDSLFGLYSSKETGSIETRFRWAIQTARTQNPRIKIIASQFWGGNPGHFSIWGYDYLALKNSSAISKYAASVANFMQTWKSFHGGLDGYDVDFEANNVSPKAPQVIKEIRQKFSVLDRHYYITVSPSMIAYLTAAQPYIDYVNMQNYAGGYYLTPQMFTKAGFSSKQLLYGICPEAGCHTRNVTEVLKQYRSNHLAGVHLWRLDSTNHPHEQDWQNQIYKAWHST